MKRAIAGAILVTSLLALAPVAHAGGFGRPDEIGARAIGMGGAFTAVADDPSAVWHNPAGLAFPSQTQVMLDIEALWLDRRWVTADNRSIPESTPIQVVPFIGASTRFGFGGDKPSRVALGIAAYNSYGGAIEFNPTDIKGTISGPNGATADGLRATSLVLFEIAPALAFQASDVLALGVSLRVGISSFSASDSEISPAPFTADLSSSGAGIGASFSAMLRAHPRLQLGAIYRTELKTATSGSGNVSVAGGMPTSHDFDLDVTWPQSAQLGAMVRASEWLRVSAQADWTGWSSFQNLTIDFHNASLTQVKPMAFADSWTFHLGGEARFARRWAVRLGGSVDTQAIPDANIRRENRDGLKYDVTGGLSLNIDRFRIDLFGDYLFGSAKTFMNHPPGGEPGRYSATVVTFGGAVSARF